MTLPNAVQELCQYRHIVSYNDSYFGEPAGLVKRAIAALERMQSMPDVSELPLYIQKNARLFAAAPDLLAVVQELEESAGYWSEYDVPLGIVDRMRAAIAKATGEPT